jgi:hypothetical protein
MKQVQKRTSYYCQAVPSFLSTPFTVFQMLWSLSTFFTYSIFLQTQDSPYCVFCLDIPSLGIYLACQQWHLRDRLAYSNEPPMSTHLDLSYYCFFALILFFACLLPVFLPMTMDNDFTERAFLLFVYCVPSVFQQC